VSKGDWRLLPSDLWDRRDRAEHLAAVRNEEIQPQLPAPPGRQLAPPGFRLFKKRPVTSGDAARERGHAVDMILEAVLGKRRR
jgi:hypothetical protein